VNQSRSSSNQWLVCPRVNPEAETRLFFFPYAGGSVATFGRWIPELPNSIEAWIAQYPGRGFRYNEPPVKDFGIILDESYKAIYPLSDKPYVFFGHSMGGLIAFELARKLGPQILFISGCGAPHIPDPNPPIHALPEDEFVKSLQKLNGIPDEVLSNAESMKIVLPSLRADFEVLENYRYTSSGHLPCPIVAFGGLDDSHVSREHLEGWAMHTNKFKSQYFIGDHFFINAERKAITDVIMSEISNAKR
jgi:medium-chain acyl-[acyl-carrier-protein] hydrolase